MTNLTEEDVLFALKRCRRLAKQDLLTSSSTPDPDFWRQRAERRREVYETLAELVRNSGVSMAQRYAWQWYRRLVVAHIGEYALAPGPQGEEDALETFLRMLGVRPAKLAALRKRRRARRNATSKTVGALRSGPDQ